MKIDFQHHKHAAPISSIAGAVVVLRRAGHELVGLCPFHPDKSPSFYVNDEKGFYHCFGCGAHGDALDFVAAIHKVGLRDAAELLGAGNLPVVQHQRPVGPVEDRNTVEEARAIWRNAVTATGTPAERYLRSRGLHLPIPASVRFARLRYGKVGDLHPTLVALVASADNQAIGIQRTYLNASGTGKAAVPKPKLSLGSVRGGAIRLAPASASLVVSEGLEDGLTLQQEMGQSVWVAAGASMLPQMGFPEGVANIVIGADGDDAGRAAACAAAEKFASQGRHVRIIYPLAPAKDFNDELQKGLAA